MNNLENLTSPHGLAIDLGDDGEMYFLHEDGVYRLIENIPPTEEDIEQRKLEAVKNTHTLSLFKMELEELYKKYGITFEYDYDSLSIEFNNDYEYDAILSVLNREIRYYEQVKGGNK